MVPFSSIAGMMFTIIAAFFVPVIGAIVLCAAGRLRWKAVIAGFFFYGLSQALLRLPLLWLFYQIPGMTSFVYSNLPGNALVMGLSAALSEECMRYVGARFAMGRRGQPVTGRDALGYGLGHSIAETFFVMGLTAFTNLMLAFALNQTGLSGYAEQFGQEEALQVYQVLTGTPALQFAAGGVERLLYTLVQICLTALVFYGVRRKNWRYPLLAAGAHFLFIAGVSLMQPHGVWGRICAGVCRDDGGPVFAGAAPPVADGREKRAGKARRISRTAPDKRMKNKSGEARGLLHSFVLQPKGI